MRDFHLYIEREGVFTADLFTFMYIGISSCQNNFVYLLRNHQRHENLTLKMLKQHMKNLSIKNGKKHHLNKSF